MVEFNFKKGDIIAYADDIYRIRKDWGHGGAVEYIDGELATNDFRYRYDGEDAVLVMTAEEAEGKTLDEIYATYSKMKREVKI